MRKLYFFSRNVSLILLTILCGLSTSAQPLSEKQIDDLVANTLVTFDVPGIAVCVIKDGKIVLEKGYGVRSLANKAKVDEHTLFGIASNSKAFTSASLAMLIDEGKVKWDDKVRKYLPGFTMYSPWVSEEFTIRDLLTHRSGLGLGAGDLMFFPDGNSFSIEEIIYNLRYLKPVSSFRSKFDYDNLLYITAGQVVEKITGKSWDDFVEEGIMKELGMIKSSCSYNRIEDKSNIIDAHGPINGVISVVDRQIDKPGMSPMGGIYSSVHDMSKWVLMQLNEGRYGEDFSKILFSEKRQKEMWSAQTNLSAKKGDGYDSHFRAYGLGWFLNDAKGYLEVSHTGGMPGMVTQVTLIPEMELGIIVLTNQQSGAAFNTITNTIKDGYLGVSGFDRMEHYSKSSKEWMAKAAEIELNVWTKIEAQQKEEMGTQNHQLYHGRFNDDWFGDVVISNKDGKLWIASEKSPKLSGEMMYYTGNTYVVKWQDRSMQADAYAIFSLDENGRPIGMKMKPISPITDFSFDFQDLDFHICQ